MNLPPFTLYGLPDCPHCIQAEQFLKIRGIPYIAMFGHNDPIIAMGVKQHTGADEFPVLVCRLDNTTISGFDEDKYERVAKLFYALASTSALSICDSEQQSVTQPSVQSKTAASS